MIRKIQVRKACDQNNSLFQYNYYHCTHKVDLPISGFGGKKVETSGQPLHSAGHDDVIQKNVEVKIG